MKVQKWCVVLASLIMSHAVLAGDRFICEQAKGDVLHTIMLDWNPPLNERQVDRGHVIHTTCRANSCQTTESTLFSLSFGWIHESANVRSISLRANAVNHGSNAPILSMRVERLPSEELLISAFYRPESLHMKCIEYLQ